jgi:hypothetical protein
VELRRTLGSVQIQLEQSPRAPSWSLPRLGNLREFELAADAHERTAPEFSCTGWASTAAYLEAVALVAAEKSGKIVSFQSDFRMPLGTTRSNYSFTATHG